MAGWSRRLLAGGGPENVLLVVNPQSPASLTIANHYVQLRQIPPDNLLFLPWDPKLETTDIDTFRQQILFPCSRRSRTGISADQIDYVVYSSDFPWGITLDSDVRKFSEEMQRSAAARRRPPPRTKSEGKPAEKPPPPRSSGPSILRRSARSTG